MAKSPICLIQDCCKPRSTRGWCRAHYIRYWRHGDPRAGRQDLISLDWLLNHTSHQDKDKCLMWPFGVNDKGYGKVSHPYSRIASRVMCMLANGGPCNGEKHAAHNCGNTGCVNPNHLRWATVSENQMDRVNHGTSNRGEGHYNSKLSRNDVLFIRRNHQEKTLSEMADMFSVTPRTVDKIIKRQRWAWL